MTDFEKSWDHSGQCEHCAAAQTPVDQCKHVRGGKTKYEHAEGTHGNRFSNRAERVSWMAQGDGNKAFPRGSCNGKRNRFLT